ncbi:NAD(P)/FAD-dependent oxidoreductase [candidate division CSSED10-310 bacterium]|uniref:NAD(P)/FAD-dependent oxidoreductase n=1 Tax=candidate division CSSED10-310 bacterium TaxID=2855610 RepID=A0ABV6YWC5_UNCC1
MHYVIIGCGASGLKAAKTIRENDPQGEINIISSDIWPLYVKPVLADFIGGQIDTSRMAYMSMSSIDELKINIITGKRVSAIVPAENRLIFSDSSDLKYQFLLIATGSYPEIPASHQKFRDKMRVLNTLSDAVRIKNESFRSNRAVVIGGGHHALEMLRCLHVQKNIDLTFLTDQDTFWERDHPISSDTVVDLLQKEKINIQWNKGVVDIIDLDGESYRVITETGNVFDVQMILYAPRFVPNMDLVKGSTIKTDKGILVSEDLRTNIPNIYACGDVAQVFDINKGLNRINFGWASASKQGALAGQNMTGKDHVFIPAHEEYFKQLYGDRLLKRW